MTTAMGNPHYLPAVCIQVTIINFTVTFEGLQEQLLSSVVKQERPYLEMERSQLLERLANDLQLLRDLEDKSLSLLQKAEGNAIVNFVPYLYPPTIIVMGPFTPSKIFALTFAFVFAQCKWILTSFTDE